MAAVGGLLESAAAARAARAWLKLTQSAKAAGAAPITASVATANRTRRMAIPPVIQECSTRFPASRNKFLLPLPRTL
jgi:hypothetical protein